MSINYCQNKSKFVSFKILKLEYTYKGDSIRIHNKNAPTVFTSTIIHDTSITVFETKRLE